MKSARIEFEHTLVSRLQRRGAGSDPQVLTLLPFTDTPRLVAAIGQLTNDITRPAEAVGAPPALKFLVSEHGAHTEYAREQVGNEKREEQDLRNAHLARVLDESNGDPFEEVAHESVLHGLS